MRLINFYYKVLTKILRTTQWLLGASTVGVRILAIKNQKEILLVKHTYMAEWHFPGGGVNSAEPARLAAIRELLEETGLVAGPEIQLYGIYFHKVQKVNDYVALYIVKQFKETTVVSPEIAEARWFSVDHLPDDLTASCQRRIAEYFENKPIVDRW